MTDLNLHFQDFFIRVAAQRTELYNEFSLQFELGCYLREQFPALKVQFERPVSYFGFSKGSFEKKEIDLSIFSPDHALKYAIELKFPRNGQHPEQMFKICQDICFLEQLVDAGFDAGYSVIVVDDPLFYSGKTEGIYGYFRDTIPLEKSVQKPTGAKDQTVELRGKYHICWHSVTSVLKYACVQIRPKE